MLGEAQFLRAIANRARDDGDGLFCEVWSGSEKQRVTNREHALRAQSFANAYHKRGVGPGDVVFIILKHSPDLYSTFLGAMLVGAVPSFLPFPSAKQDPELYWSSLTAVFNRTGSKLLVTYDELAAEIAVRTRVTVQLLIADNVATAVELTDTPLPDDDAVALLQHSSGTTGLKKGVMLSYRAIRMQIESYSAALELDAGASRIASWLPLYHDMGLIACFLTPMYLGVPVISLDAFEWTTRPALLLEAIELRSATHAWLPNFAFAHIARATPTKRRFDLSSVKAIVGCSEPNRSATFDQFHHRFESEGLRKEALKTCYAMAETVFAVSQSSVEAPPRRISAVLNDGAVEPGAGPGSIEYLSNGAPIPGMDVKALHDGKLHGEGVSGELCVRAPFMFDGYFNDPAATKAAFIDGYFRTGDVGFIENGEIYISGRIKELIIVNGRNFFAHDVEMVANGVDGVKKGRCVAFGVHVAAIGSEQIVIVAERDDTQPSGGAVETAITQAMNQHLGTAPGDVRLVDPGWLIKTTSGKISRAENARKYLNTFRSQSMRPSAPAETHS